MSSDLVWVKKVVRDAINRTRRIVFEDGSAILVPEAGEDIDYDVYQEWFDAFAEALEPQVRKLIVLEPRSAKTLKEDMHWREVEVKQPAVVRCHVVGNWMPTHIIGSSVIEEYDVEWVCCLRRFETVISRTLGQPVTWLASYELSAQYR